MPSGSPARLLYVWLQWFATGPVAFRKEIGGRYSCENTARHTLAFGGCTCTVLILALTLDSVEDKEPAPLG